MDIQSVVENEMELDSLSSVWVLKGHEEFGYSDGVKSEHYLSAVLQNATDLGSRSEELETCIRDWPSEYHLSSRRAQLLSGFTFDRSLRVLEVGCGCGAITRFLGETFESVVAIEGSLARARVASLRTRDIEGVSIVCAPFHELTFSKPFDIVFCIGVYEYSATFVGGANPYGAALQHFSDVLSPDGVLILAIENQFGLKYFNAFREDHLGTRFEGLEGYHAQPSRARTFGKVELERDLRCHFPDVRFYYPYPDYKLPICVLDEEFLATGQAAELVSQMRSLDHGADAAPLWDEIPVLLELGRNRMLEFFSNSFLIVAGKRFQKGISFGQLGLLYSWKRKAAFSTVSKVVRSGSGDLVIRKQPVSGAATVETSVLRLTSTESPWADSYSLHTVIYLRCKSHGGDIDRMFEPARQWVDYLTQLSIVRSGVRFLGGEYVDCTWSNAYLVSDALSLVDREWVWQTPVPFNVVIIRAIHDFLTRIEGSPGLSRELATRSGKAVIRRIGCSIGAELSNGDFDAFVELESRFQAEVFGVPKWRHAFNLRWFLLDRPTMTVYRDAKRLMRRIRAFTS